MPIYEYECQRCWARLEELRSFADRLCPLTCKATPTPYEVGSGESCGGLMLHVPSVPGQGVVKGEGVYRRRN